VIEPLELHGGPAADRLPHVEPLKVEVTVERVESKDARVGVEDADLVLVEAGRELRALEQAETARDTRGSPSHVSLLASDFGCHRPLGEQVGADHDRAEAARVVDVRDRDVLTPRARSASSVPDRRMPRRGRRARGRATAAVLEEESACL
jgi:hypothetical protein